MSYEELEKKYNEILGSDDNPAMQTEQESSAKVDSAYKQPAYDGQDGDDGVDPRDPSTFKDSDEDQSQAEGGEDGDEENNDNDSEQPEGENSQQQDEETEPIPEQWVQAGRAAGLSDDEIVELAENNESVLKKLASAVAFNQSQFAASQNYIEGQQGQPQDEKNQEEDKSPKNFDKLDIDLEEFDMDEEAKAVFKKMQSGFNNMADIVNRLNSRLENNEAQLNGVASRQQIETRRRVDEFYDNAGKEIPILGNSSSLTQENIEARNEVQQVAYAYQQAHKCSDEQALAIGLNALKGRLGKQEIHSKIVQGLQRRKATTTFRPTSRKTNEKSISAKEKVMRKYEEILGPN